MSGERRVERRDPIHVTRDPSALAPVVCILVVGLAIFIAMMVYG